MLDALLEFEVHNSRPTRRLWLNQGEIVFVEETEKPDPSSFRALRIVMRNGHHFLVNGGEEVVRRLVHAEGMRDYLHPGDRRTVERTLSSDADSD